MQTRRSIPRILALIGMLTTALALACGASFELVELDEAQELTIPGALAGQPLEDEELDTGEGFDPLQSPEMEKYGGTAAAIGEATLTGASLTIKEGATNLDFLDSLQFFIASGQDQVLIASEPNVPPNVSWLELDINEDVDLTDFINEGDVRPIIKVTGVGPDVTTTLEIEFTMSLGVSVAETCEAIFQ